MIDATGLAITFIVPMAGRYSIGVDYSKGADEAHAVVLKIGVDGASDEIVQTLHLDKGTRKWVPEGEE